LHAWAILGTVNKRLRIKRDNKKWTFQRNWQQDEEKQNKNKNKNTTKYVLETYARANTNSVVNRG
jgi:hypothetical protein